MKELFPNIYMQVLEFYHKTANPLNLYVIYSEQRSLLIDTGLHFHGCMDAIQNMLSELHIPFDKLDIFITHNHPDHSGLAEELAERGSRIYMNPAEANRRYDLMHCYLTHGKIQEKTLRTIGITAKDTEKLYHAFTVGSANEFGGKYEVPDFPYIPIEPGQTLRYGEYSFKVVSLRGHTYGQLGLAENVHRLLFCADQIMTRIVPNVGSMYRDISLLECYMESMEIMKHTYGNYVLLPGHYEVITDVEKEVNRIVYSYLDKCGIMKRILSNNGREMTVSQVGMHAYGRTEDSLSRDGFVTFTMIMAKTFSCLEYLYEEGFIKRSEKEGILFWSISK